MNALCTGGFQSRQRYRPVSWTRRKDFPREVELKRVGRGVEAGLCWNQEKEDLCLYCVPSGLEENPEEMALQAVVCAQGLGSCQKYSWQELVLEDLNSEQSWKQCGAMLHFLKRGDLMKARLLEDKSVLFRVDQKPHQGLVQLLRNGLSIGSGIGYFELVQSLSAKMINLV